MKKLLITGSNGFVGSYLARAAKGNFFVFGVSNKEGRGVDMVLDLSDSEKWRELLKKENPDIVVHTAALTWVEFSEDHHEETDAINIRPVEVLASWAKHRKNAPHIIFISSDYVYEGVHGPYTEKSKVAPVNYYGVSKASGEEFVRTLTKGLILRTGVVFGWHPGGLNFFMQLKTKLEKGEHMQVPQDQISNPTYVETLVDYIMRSVGKELTGTFNATGPEILDRYTFALRIAEAFKLNAGLIVPVATASLNQKAKRPMDDGTDISAIQKALHFTSPSLKDNFKQIKKRMKAD